MPHPFRPYASDWHTTRAFSDNAEWISENVDAIERIYTRIWQESVSAIGPGSKMCICDFAEWLARANA